jgi:hypothetical protein
MRVQMAQKESQSESRYHDCYLVVFRPLWANVELMKNTVMMA